MTKIIWSQFIDLQKIDISHKSLEKLPPGISQCEGVETVVLEYNSLVGLPKDFGELGSLKVLNLNHNKLKNLPQCLFKLHTLEELSANNNFVEAVHKDVGNLCDLTHLDLSYNKLITLTPGVGFLNRLKHVNLSNNELQSIPHELTGICGMVFSYSFLSLFSESRSYEACLERLVELDISCNRVERIPCVRNLLHLKVFKANGNLLKNLPDFGQCRELVSINFSHNQIEEIDSANLNSQPFLREVFLQNNKIKSLPNDFTNLSTLQVLDISSNKIDILPADLVDFPNMQILRIAKNPFKDIPLHYAKADTIRLLTYLRERQAMELENQTSDEVTSQDSAEEHPTARFSLCHLRRSGSLVHTYTDSDVPDAVWDNAVSAQVVVVNLSHCKQPLSDRVVELAESLMELHLVDTGLAELPKCVGQLRELQVLALDQNLLTDLCPELASCKYMRELSLTCNRFAKIPAVLWELRLLRVLNLSNNKLTDISSACCGLQKLQHLDSLDLSNNEIPHLPPELGLMTHLRLLVVTGNMFRQPSYQVLSKGTEAVLAYLRNKLPEEVKEDVVESSRPANISYFIS